MIFKFEPDSELAIRVGRSPGRARAESDHDSDRDGPGDRLKALSPESGPCHGDARPIGTRLTPIAAGALKQRSAVRLPRRRRRHRNPGAALRPLREAAEIMVGQPPVRRRTSQHGGGARRPLDHGLRHALGHGDVLGRRWPSKPCRPSSATRARTWGSRRWPAGGGRSSTPAPSSRRGSGVGEWSRRPRDPATDRRQVRAVVVGGAGGERGARLGAQCH